MLKNFRKILCQNHVLSIHHELVLRMRGDRLEGLRAQESLL
jgi:hypothetical protein